jgi:NAD(P)-dependent dehydrogenase (short-subunit alcohol dehydrogenase family)
MAAGGLAEEPTVRTTAIVTGGGRGIGLAAARALAGRGVAVTVFARTASELDAAVRSGAAARACAGDVAREEDVSRLLAEHERALGPVDVLVNDAGILVRGLAEDTSPADFRRVLDVNLVGAFLCARAVIPSMKARRRGRIVNVASISATVGTPGSGAYNASKWGLLGLTKCLADELREHGIACIAVSPGSTDTAMLARTPFAPRMTAEDVAGVIAWAALDAPAASTGANLEVFG